MEATSADATVTLYLSNRSSLLFVQKIHFRTKPKFLEKRIHHFCGGSFLFYVLVFEICLCCWHLMCVFIFLVKLR